MKIRCNSCGHTFFNDERRTVGCLCDSDAPTWIGVSPDKRLVLMSYANYDILEE